MIIKKTDISAAYEAGQNLQITLLREGISNETIRQIKNIMKNHPDDILKSFFKGLLGMKHE